jgi:hypothetical protein
LVGARADIEELKTLAPHYDCVIAPSRAGHECLSGRRFDGLYTAEEVRVEAMKILKLLNGIARMRWSEFLPVKSGAVSQNQCGGAKTFFVDVREEVRIRESLDVVVVRIGDGTTARAIAPDLETRRVMRIIADPNLHEIAEVLAEDLTWQRLRIAFEKICALITGQTARGRWDNTLIKNEYATLDEVKRFKANIEDPRLSGLNAVHGVPDGPNPKGTKMTEREGLEFVVKLLNTHIARRPIP